MIERQRLKLLGIETDLREDELQFVSFRDSKLCARFRADAYPINSSWPRYRSVSFNRDLKTVTV